MEYTLTQEMVKEYERHLWLAERSSGTILKYLHNIEQFRRYLPREKTVTKETVIAYKKSIAEKYAISTANAALVALNGLFSFLSQRCARLVVDAHLCLWCRGTFHHLARHAQTPQNDKE